MKKVTLLVEEGNGDLFLKFLKTLDYVKVLNDGTFEDEKSGLEGEKLKQPEDHIKEPLKKFLNRM